MMAVTNPGPPVDAAVHASGSSFYLAMRIMPRAQRRGMYEIYAFCRAVDDIADGHAAIDWKLAQLRRWRSNIDRFFTDGHIPPDMAALCTAIQDFHLTRADFHAVIDGMEMDVTGAAFAPDWATLDLYCDRVASAVGRLSVHVFGMDERSGQALAHHLGRALQLTNILRDIDEDAVDGRLYLPREALEAAAIAPGPPLRVVAHPNIETACLAVAARARQHFAEAEAILSQCPRKTVRTPRIMASAYNTLLNALIDRGWRFPRPLIEVNRLRIAWLLLRHMII